jgi:PhnB protein
MADLLSYLKFKGNCREAMTFYQSCLGGDLNIQTIGDSPMKANMPPEMHDKVMHSILNNGTMMLMASDLADDNYQIGNAQDLSLICKTREEMETYFTKLSEGGKVEMAPQEMFFGWFASFNDKFGFKWMMQAGEMKS